MHNTTKTVAAVSLLAVFIGFLGAAPTRAQQVDPVDGKNEGIIIDVDAAAARAKFKEAHPETFVYTVADRVIGLAGQVFSQGTSPSRSAEAFVRQHVGIFGARTQDIMPFGAFPDAIHSLELMWDEATESSAFTVLGYSQVVEGIPVFGSALKLLIKNEAGFPLVLANADLRDLGDFPATLAGRRPTLADFDQRVWSSKAITHRAFGEPQDAQLVIFAGFEENAAQPTLAVSFVVERGVLGTDTPSTMLYVADARTGKVLFSESQILHLDVSGTVKGNITAGTPLDPNLGPDIVNYTSPLCVNGATQPTGLPYARVTASIPQSGVTQTGFADKNGDFFLPLPGGGQGLGVVVSTLGSGFQNDIAGKFFKVVNVANLPASQATGNFFNNQQNIPLLHTTTDENLLAQVNAYYHANRARDMILQHLPPQFSQPNGTWLIGNQVDANAFQINLFQPPDQFGVCAAFYNARNNLQGTINFGGGGVCLANSAFGSPVIHEYGHHLVRSACGLGTQSEYNEGQADVMSVLVTETPNIAIGISGGNCNPLRRVNVGTKYVAGNCSTAGSEIYACSAVLSGSVWDLWLLMQLKYPGNPTFKTLVRQLAINSTFLQIGGGINYMNLAIYLALDQTFGGTTGNYCSGSSPNYAVIAEAFRRHGLDVNNVCTPLTFAVAGGFPIYTPPAASYGVQMTLSALAGEPQSGTGRLFWREGSSGEFTSVAMTEGAANVYTASLPMGKCGSIVEYYFQAQTTTGQTVTSPANAPTNVYTTTGGYGDVSVLFDNLETDTGWTAGIAGDTASAGKWTLVVPNGTPGQPSDDYTTGTGVRCALTGQVELGGFPGDADVDNGETTLMTPVFSATDGGVSDPWISYARWYSNDLGENPNADSMPVEISNDDGATWVQLELVTESSHEWSTKAFRVADFVTPTAAMRVRWVASDLGGDSFVKAGVDDFRVFGITCTPPSNPADLNNDGAVNGTDLAILLSGWGTAAGDVDGNGSTDGYDLAVLTAAWTG